MKSTEAIKLCSSYMQDMDNSKIERILKSDNMLCRHTLTNRVLIELQDKDSKVTDVRTKEEWFILGRRVRDNAKSIKLITVSSGLNYLDTTTGKAINCGEFTNDELDVALKSGFIQKQEDIAVTKIVHAYDYADTYEVEAGLYRRDITPGFFIMSDICKRMYDIEFTTDQKANSDSKIYVPKDAYKAIEIIVDTIIKASKCEQNMLRYALYSMLGMSNNHIDCYDIDSINDVQDVIRDILKNYLIHIGYTEQAYSSIDSIEESKRMLDIIKYCMLRTQFV